MTLIGWDWRDVVLKGGGGCYGITQYVEINSLMVSPNLRCVMIHWCIQSIHVDN